MVLPLQFVEQRVQYYGAHSVCPGTPCAVSYGPLNVLGSNVHVQYDVNVY